MVFHWILSDSKSPQVSRTRLSILAVLSNAVIWILSTRPPTSKSSRPFNNRLVIVPKALIIIGTIVTFMFHSFFQFSNKVEVLILLFTFLQIYSVVPRDSKVDNFANSLFLLLLLLLLLLLIIIRSGLLAGIRWSVCMVKSHRSLLLLLFIYFSAKLSLPYNPSQVLYSRPRVRKGILYIHVFCFLFWVIFFSHTDRTFLKR